LIEKFGEPEKIFKMNPDEIAAEVTASLNDHVVDVRLVGRDVQVVVTDTAPPRESANDDAPPPPPNGTGDISRMTLRLVEQLKSKAEQAAAAQGVSLNTFVQQAVSGALHGKRSSRGGDWGSRSDWGDFGDRDSSRIRGWYEG